MNDSVTPIEMLFEKAEEYSKTSIELLKLQAVGKYADVVSSLISKAVISISVALSILLLSVGVAIWLGKMMGAYYYGFFIVAGAYVTVAIICYFLRTKCIINPIKNSIIAKHLL